MSSIYRNWKSRIYGLKDRLFSDYQLHELIWSETGYNSVYFDDKFLVTGHRPVQLITNGQRDITLKMNNHFERGRIRHIRKSP